jgi:glycosyltransferase involved in cell wall biosynthesis
MKTMKIGNSGAGMNRTFFYIALIAYCGMQAMPSLCAKKQEFDLTVVSSIDFNGSVRRHGIGLIDCLKDKLKLNFIPSRPVDLTEVSPEVQKIVLSAQKTPGAVAILEDPLWFAEAMPNSKIKIAFSVFESTKIPAAWVQTLNTKFDAVVVADPFYIKVYENSGVQIPVFHIPLGIYVDEFLEKPLKKAAHKPFVFGCCSRFFRRKNHDLLIKAFAAEFGNNKDVILRINGGGKWGSGKIYDNLKQLIKQHKLSNVHLTNDALPWKDYIELMSSFDCYINISQGEGFSITPREALALGIPAIVTNNTAQKTICASHLVRAVPCPIKVPRKRRKGDSTPGFQFNCTQKAVQNALTDVYNNYDSFLAKAHKGRAWVEQYRWPSLQKKYLNLVKPKNLKWGKNNIVTDDYLMTNSKKLYTKYQSLSKQNIKGKVR